MAKYKYEQISVYYSDIEITLNDFANNGWRLHTILPCSDGTWVCVFERSEEPLRLPE